MIKIPIVRNAILLLFFGMCSWSSSAQFFHDHNEELPCIDKQYNVFTHVTLDSTSKNPIISQHQVDSILSLTSRYFNPICLSFRSCENNIIPNYTFSEIYDSLRFVESVILHAKPRRLNIFFVKSAPFLKCGFSIQDGIQERNSANIFIETSCGDSPTEQLAHHVGHLFGLVDTNGPGNPVELVDGSNCAVAGDLLCDTPADPFGRDFNLQPQPKELLHPSLYVEDCEFKMLISDANDQFFQPNVGNMMSNYYCKCGFTRSQYLLMVENYNRATFKHY